MIYLPWIAFLIIVLWMIRQGDKAKQDYLSRKVEQTQPGQVWVAQVRMHLEEQAEAMTAQGRLQGEAQKSVEGFGNPKHPQTLPTQERPTEWKM
jgi:hypothetical protein